MHLKGRETLVASRVRAIAGVQVRIGEHGALFEQPDLYNIRVLFRILFFKIPHHKICCKIVIVL